MATIHHNDFTTSRIEQENDFIEKVQTNDVIGVKNILLMLESQLYQTQKQDVVGDKVQEQNQQQNQTNESIVNEQQQEQQEQQEKCVPPLKQYSKHISSLVNCSDRKNGMTPLMYATKSIEMITILLEYGAAATNNINGQDNDGRTALHHASYYGNYYNYDIILLLLQNHINPNIQNKYGETSLHIACSRWDSKMILLLIQYHANVNIQTIPYKNTPLHYMTQNYHYYDDIENGINILCNHNANVNIQNIYGETPLYNAIENFGNYRICCIELLMKYKANINIQRTKINDNNNNQCHNDLFPDNLFPNDTKYHKHNHNNSIVGDTPLHCAIRNNDIYMIQLLLTKYYPNINICNNNNETIYDLVQQTMNNTDKNTINQSITTYIKKIRTMLYQYLYEIWMNQK